MRLSTRLLLPLLAVVLVVMGAYGWWALRQREETLVLESERETRAYARALGLAVERAMRDPDLSDVQEIIDRISLEPAVYGVLVYDREGTPVVVSGSLGSVTATAPADYVRGILRADSARTVFRDLGEEPVVAVVRALLDDTGEVLGALEVAHPLAFVVAERGRIRQRFLLNALTLVAVLSLMVTWLVRRHVSRPIGRFVEAVRVLGEGDLSHRIAPEEAAGELSEVAEELNRMATRLEEARGEVVREAEERVLLGRRLQQTEKMAAVGNLAAGLAHEIGAPLHVIRGRAEQLLRRDAPAHSTERQLRIIIQQIDRIALIVRNLLGYARRRQPRRLTLDVVEVVRGVVEFLDTELNRADATVDLDVPDRPVRLRGDPDLLHQVFLNLTLNALHAMGSGEGERVLGITISQSATEVVVDVTDSGPGIPQDVRERIFDPFFTTKEGHQGTGLGLAVALGIVEDHGGVLEVVDEPDRGAEGACLRVRLPLEAQPPGPLEGIDV